MKTKILMWPAYKNFTDNPFNMLLAESIVKAGGDVRDFNLRQCAIGKYDILHIHWPEWFFSRKSLIIFVLGFIRLFMTFVMSKMHGAAIIWTVHNLCPHNCDRKFKWIEPFFYRFLQFFVDGVVFLSTTSQSQFYKIRGEEWKKKRSLVSFHGHYRSIIQRAALSQSQSRVLSEIGVDDFVFLYFGKISNYKNVSLLIREFKKMKEKSTRLVILGNPDSRETQIELEELAKLDTRVILQFRHFSEEEAAHWLNVSDVVVLPYKNILNSGSVLYALSHNCPCLCPAIGSLPELAEIVKSGIRLYKGDLSVLDLVNVRNDVGFASKSMINLTSLNWDTIGVKHHRFYKNFL